MKKIILSILMILTLSACSLQSLFQGPGAPGSAAEQAAMERQFKEEMAKMKMGIPGHFQIDPHNYDYYIHVEYDESCRKSAPYLANDGNSTYVGMHFTSKQIGGNKVSDTEAKSTYIVTLNSINIENHIVDLGKQTVGFDGEAGPALTLDPQIWLDKANEINSTEVTVTPLPIILRR
jgi:hypothetical protein